MQVNMGQLSRLVNENALALENSTGSFACVFSRRHVMLDEGRFLPPARIRGLKSAEA
jgi:hypothetical protein